MNMKKLSIFSFLVAALLFLGGCAKEEISNVTINIVSPTEGAVVTDASNVTVKVDISTDGDELHEIEIVLHPDGDTGDKIIDFDGHEHEPSYSFSQSVDLSGYAAGTSFHLEVVVCRDHDCEETEEGEITFSIP
jgi:hypothetical protein